MRLDEPAFYRMLAGEKTIEYRLNDEKRKLVKVGDEIEFLKLPSLDERMLVDVIGLRQFGTFRETALFYGEDPEAFVEGSYFVYSREDEAMHGSLAIQIKVKNYAPPDAAR